MTAKRSAMYSSVVEAAFQEWWSKALGTPLPRTVEQGREMFQVIFEMGWNIRDAVLKEGVYYKEYLEGREGEKKNDR